MTFRELFAGCAKRRGLPHPEHDPTCPTQLSHQSSDCECGAADRLWRARREQMLRGLE